MQKILLIDGIKFNLWTPNLEEKEFHPIIKEHAKEIFGKDTIYLDISTRLKSEAGIGSEPDGFVIDPVNLKLYVVEIELSKHDPYKHINIQLTSFINGMDNLAIKNKIVDALGEEIESDRLLEGCFKEKVKENPYKWLSKLLNKPPIIVVVIEDKTVEVCEACKILVKSYDTRIIEFQTFQREDAPTVHAHLFEPLFEATELKESSKAEEEKSQSSTFSLALNTIDVFFVYKGKKYLGKYVADSQKIIYKDKEYSPSAVSGEITNTSRNGWRDWKFLDEQGREHSIDELR